MSETPPPLTQREHIVRRELLEFADFDQFIELVQDEPPLRTASVPRQIEKIKKFLTERNLKCHSILVERHYVDRAFMDEYREFYAASYLRYNSSCIRLHFFHQTKGELISELQGLEAELATIDPKKEWLEAHGEYLKLCRQFSKKYLGFMVVKPLPATRIGRTVLRHPRHDKSEDNRALFPCTKFYTAHVMGIELSVCGLPFQQQDGGMSACASTALWSSLSQSSEYEQFQVPSPAAITKFASSHKTNFGRSIPQGGMGLTSAQMTQAIEAAGLSPYMVSLKGLRGNELRSLVYSAIRSGFAPMLLLSCKDEKEKHVVAVAGANLGKKYKTDHESGVWINEESSKIEALYINDDRIAPYHFSKLTDDNCLEMGDKESPWNITHMLIPLHPKIRFAFTDLYQLGSQRVLIHVDIWCKKSLNVEVSEQKPLELEYRIVKGRTFRQRCLWGPNKLKGPALNRLNREFGFPRYIGVIQVSHPDLGKIDLIVDATNTVAHLKMLMILGREGLTDKGIEVIARLSKMFGGRTLFEDRLVEKPLDSTQI